MSLILGIRPGKFGLALACAALMTGAMPYGAAAFELDKTQQAVVDELLTSFEGGCSAGAWTAAALDRSTRLTGVFKALNSKASCRDHQNGNPNLEDALLGASTLEQALTDALERESSYRNERIAEENANDLYFVLQDPNLDAYVRAQLLSYYASQRYEVSYNRTVLNYLDRSSFASRGASGLSRFSSLSSAMLANTTQISACLADNPAKAIDIGANLGLVAGSFAPPLVGLGIAAVSQLLKVGVEAATAYPSAKAVYETRRNRMPAAMTCGLEALSRDYCKARDAYALINLDRKENTRREPSPFFYGIELADRDLPILYQWLDQVVGGSSSATVDQSKKVNDQFARLNRILGMRRNTEGVLGEMDQYLKNPKFNETDRLTKIKEAIGDVILRALFMDERGMGYPYPYPDGPFVNDDPFLLAAHLAGIPPNLAPPYRDNQSLRVFIGSLPITYTATLGSEIRSRALALLAERHTRVLAEFIQKVNINPPIVIRDASSMTAGGLSAIGTLERLDRFFEIFAFGQPPYKEQDEELINQVRMNLNAIREKLNNVNATQPGMAEEIIADVFKVFKLENTNVFLPTHLQNLIRNDLTTRYRRGEGPKSVDDILLTAGRDIDALLSRTKLGPVEVRGDLELAQSTTISTIAKFRGFFGSSIGNAIWDLQQQADRNREPPLSQGSRSPSRHTAARLCILTLISGTDWPQSVNKSLCRGAKIFSPDARLELSFDALDAKLNGTSPVSLDDRLCLHQEFLRLDRLASQDLTGPGDSEPGKMKPSAADRKSQLLWQGILDSRLHSN
ncbi:MAG: hypothetical protein NDJ89_05340 [Oligoflexia bacterium]|nr:hypothetical protein [Oligoflexia bacterium]